MKKVILLIMLLLTLVSCNNQNEPKDEVKYTTIVKDFKRIDIEVEETYNLSYVLNGYNGITFSIVDENIVNVDGNIITGKSVGETVLELALENKRQKVTINVLEPNALQSTFSFEKGRLAGKNIVAFGDSVTANATIGGNDTYYDLFAKIFGMNAVKNYAIGGTTGTYMYEGSNIYKEYHSSTVAIDGVRVVKKAYDLGELNNIDYAFIAYGHNDQYFQPPITVNGDTEYDVNSFASCHSFKGSYRYMINTLKLANPNIRIILLDCTYSEYDKANPSPYGKIYSYTDYRVAIQEIALEYDLTYIELWDYLRPYYDNYDSKIYYKDAVHLSEAGHRIIATYLSEYREEK